MERVEAKCKYVPEVIVLVVLFLFFFFFCKLMYSNPPTLAWLTTPVSLNVLPVCSCCMSVRMYVSVDACSICSFV